MVGSNVKVAAKQGSTKVTSKLTEKGETAPDGLTRFNVNVYVPAKAMLFVKTSCVQLTPSNTIAVSSGATRAGVIADV